MMWLWGVILVLIMAVIQTTAVPVELTAMLLAALGFRLGRAELVWLAVWGGVALDRGLATIMALWLVAVAGWAYRRFGGEPRWWIGAGLAVIGSGLMRWLMGGRSIVGMLGDVAVWAIIWLAISWWQERWGDEMV